MNDSVEVYGHSGVIGLGGGLALVVGALAALILAQVYAYVSVYSPIAGWISILFVLGYGFGIGVSFSTAVRVFKVRSPVFATLTGVVIGLLALYTAWAAFCAVLLARYPVEGEVMPGYFDLLAHPDALWAFVGFLGENGWFSMGSGDTPVSGIPLWICWGIEAVLVVGMTAMAAPAGIQNGVFCESCRVWADKGEPVATAVPDGEQAEAIAAGDLDALERLTPVEEEPAFLLIETRSCPRCDLTNSYMVSLVVLEPTKEGGVNRVTTALTPHYLVVGTDYQRVLAVPHPLPEQEPAEDALNTDEESEQA